jgi:hypothetical protein
MKCHKETVRQLEIVFLHLTQSFFLLHKYIKLSLTIVLSYYCELLKTAKNVRVVMMTMRYDFGE